MGYLDTYTTPLTAQTAAHLLRRATFGPTNQEIDNLIGKTASQAVDFLIGNAPYRASPPDPLEMDETRPDAGQPFLSKPFVGGRNYYYSTYVTYWWLGLMNEQNGHPSVLEKLTAFWQNHFVISYARVEDVRFLFRYLQLLRKHALGNFKTFTIEVTKDPGMLKFLNGSENSKEQPNENYGRELQELLTVGVKDFNGNSNFTEQDVKMAAKVLTGWQAVNYAVTNSTTIGVKFTATRHDTSDKVFSSKYNNTTIAGRSGDTAGDEELNDLVTMLLGHPQTPRFICRKLFRWYVNTNVTQDIEDNVIGPLASFFASPANNFEIAPVLKKLLSSDIFYDEKNIGSMVKSPAEFMIGIIRHFNFPVPDMVNEYAPFRRMMEYQEWAFSPMQLWLLYQPTIFGSLPYYQEGYTKNWLNGNTVGIRRSRTDNFIWPWLQIKPGYMLGVDFLKLIDAVQPNFSDVTGTPSVTCEIVFEAFVKNLFAVDLTLVQKNFIIDQVMVQNVRPAFVSLMDIYRASSDNGAARNFLILIGQRTFAYLLKLPEYQIF